MLRASPRDGTGRNWALRGPRGCGPRPEQPGSGVPPSGGGDSPTSRVPRLEGTFPGARHNHHGEFGSAVYTVWRQPGAPWDPGHPVCHPAATCLPPGSLLSPYSPNQGGRTGALTSSPLFQPLSPDMSTLLWPLQDQKVRALLPRLNLAWSSLEVFLHHG